ncbi:MAG: type II secretion system F family protein [Patescibacteria group bacterium]|jgi:type IV pilus assembly protein PilC
MTVILPPQNNPENQPEKSAETAEETAAESSGAPNAAPKSVMRSINRFLEKFSTIPISEKLFFVQNLSIMLKAGISLSVSLKTLAKQTNNKRFSAIINDISANVEKGVSFTESLKPHEKVFGQLFVNMIESGEISGKLEEVLKRLFIQFKKNHELVSKVKGALTYPAVILFAMGGIGIFMMVAVVPKITAMFKDFNAELPFATKILIKFSDSLVSNGLLYLIGLVVFVLILVQAIKTKKGKYIFHGLLLKLPVFSTIIKKINLARFARTISSLLKTDIMIIKSLQITASVLGNVYYRDALNEMSVKIKKGGTINEVISSYEKLFPPIVTQMISVGEETGELDFILEELAEFYEGEVDQTMNNLPAIIEPILILTLGLVVGAMAIAIIMPMYSLTSAI